MGVLTKKGNHELELDGRPLRPGDRIEVRRGGHWVAGVVAHKPAIGPVFVDDSGGTQFLGLDGASARLPGGGPDDPLEEAYEELLGAARQAAALLKLLQLAHVSLPETPGERTYSRLLDAIVVASQCREQAQGAAR